MKFKYRQIDIKNPFSKNKSIFRPIIPLSIGHKSVYIRFEALIDSGADFSIFPLGIAKRLNIKPEGKERVYFSGVGDSLNEGFIAQVSITLDKDEIQTKIIFSNSLEVDGILGQHGFFDKFIVKFDLTEKEIDLTLRK